MHDQDRAYCDRTYNSLWQTTQHSEVYLALLSSKICVLLETRHLTDLSQRPSNYFGKRFELKETGQRWIPIPCVHSKHFGLRMHVHTHAVTSQISKTKYHRTSVKAWSIAWLSGRLSRMPSDPWSVSIIADSLKQTVAHVRTRTKYNKHIANLTRPFLSPLRNLQIGNVAHQTRKRLTSLAIQVGQLDAEAVPSYWV